jgi:hypothetical protein
MRNWMLGLPGRILCEQFPWCQRKRWACSWLHSSHVSPFSGSVSLNFPCTAHAFFPERLSNHCQGLRSTLYETCTKSDAISFSDPPLNRFRPDTRLQIKELKKISTSTQLRKFMYTDSHHMLVLSSTIALRYYNYCTDSSISPGNYGYHVFPLQLNRLGPQLKHVRVILFSPPVH